MSELCGSGAGHAGAVLGDTWYIAGGGNNTSGCTDMLALDLLPLAEDSPSDEPLTWSIVSHADARGAIVSEGMTVQAVPSAKCLLAFGGYNGKYQNALQVFKAGGKARLQSFHAQQVCMCARVCIQQHTCTAFVMTLMQSSFYSSRR